MIIDSIDLAQGCKTVLGRMAGKELRISYDQVNVLNEAADAPPFCFGSFASRVTLIGGNTVVSAGQGSQGNFIRFTRQGAGSFCAGPCGRRRENPSHRIAGKSVTIADLAGKSPLIVGRRNYVPTPATLYPQTGA